MAPSSEDLSFQERQKMADDYRKFLHTASLATVFIAPVLIILPPRKLDLYTFSLAGAFVVSANYQTKQRTGAGFMGHLGRPFAMPKRAQEIQAQQMERKRLLEEAAAPAERKKGSLLEEKAREIWMGGETEGWKERRLKEEQEKLDQGEGYWDMIRDQVWEVWNWGEKKAEDLKEKDEEVLQSKKKS
ncbi:hypothetical protein LTR10_020678 [Elasticomyces elasticus]|uniref:Uncharacterized protein n=1 Tax=Exophiala sideris TaxID=1016849 RepID=A0ABR0JHH9_9EURO|nr:hypothetical protein LTR10_020678 [Elasticomyces elasticus]KAK5033575.1 hypothetical protein LTS07_003880 [Exophiala sideris]KAK5041930.1 hypothetical protein LTR13_001735 [Exophiala sideris]KAK5064119.1 hypothetical protein LTR69_003888 [Exophiala sideris]KAK5185198.1 hypothetical protein LTR44_002186 [Eurotiomycetes sp. CCFEE 6388]